MPAHQGRPPCARSDARIRPFIPDSLARIFLAAPREWAGEGDAIGPQDLRCDPGEHTARTRSVDIVSGYRP